MEGQLIIFEGGDGTGKSTQAEKLCSVISGRRNRVRHVREPGSTAVSEKIRDILLCHPDKRHADITPETEVFLYMAARAQLFGEVIAPALERGETVILDRSYFSTYAYQGSGLGLDRSLILQLGEWAVGGIRPARVVVLDMDPAESFDRLDGTFDRVESRDLAYHRRVRGGFLELAERFGDLFVVIDGSAPPDEVHKKVLEALHDAL